MNWTSLPAPPPPAIVRREGRAIGRRAHGRRLRSAIARPCAGRRSRPPAQRGNGSGREPAGGTKRPSSVHRVEYYTEWCRAEHGRAPETAMSNRILGRLRPRGGEGRRRRSQSQGRSQTAVSDAGSSGVPADAGTATECEIVRSNEEWKAILTPEQYRVLRRHGTERAGSSPLNFEKRTGTFLCAGCGLALYPAEAKFDSGTGWPSFWDSLEGAVDTSLDRSYFMTRTEVHCRRCGGHLGHVFGDGPPPTGKRHCINGLALTFEPDRGGE